MLLYLLTVTEPPKTEGTGGLQFRTAAKMSHREFVEVDSDMAALPQVLHHVAARVEIFAPIQGFEDPLDDWDALHDKIEEDRERACDLDEDGVSYKLPDGREIAATAIDMAQLDEITAGYLEAALWVDCMPDDVCRHCERPVEFHDDKWRHADTGARACHDSEYHYAERDEDAELGGKEDLEPDDELRERARLDCAVFMAMAGDDLESYVQACEDGTQESYDPSQGPPLEWAGHDLWLTKRGHGTGFWDRGLGELGDRLTTAAERLDALVPEFYPYDKGDGTAGLS